MSRTYKKTAVLTPEEQEKRRQATRNRVHLHRSTHPTTQTEHVRKPRKRKGDNQFIAIDGEGADIHGVHTYILLAASTGEMIASEEGLSTLQCLQFLIQLAETYKDAIFCVFGASYDVNMWLKDINQETLKVLHGYTDKEGVRHDATTITYKGLRIKYRSRKELWIGVYDTPAFIEDKEGKKHPNYRISFSVWDVIGFFQGTFVKSVESYLGKDYPSLEQIKAGKERRSQFTADELENFIIPYCQLELSTLVELMNCLRKNLQTAGLHISRWDGAGACAAALLKRENIKAHMDQHFPKAIRDAAQHAYAGGRIELQYYGHCNQQVYHYDINSAYPHAMLYLPSLRDGKWRHHKNPTTRTIYKNHLFTLYRVEWSFNPGKSFYPFPFRLQQGNIRYPQTGHTWVWGPELLAALDNEDYLGGKMIIHECYAFHPSTQEQPFHFLPALFEQRKVWKQEGNGAEKALKLAINSLYGKQVQHVGYGHEDGKIPPYHQLEWGGFVTSFTRAMLFQAAMQAPSMIICLATDGIFSTIPLDLPVSSNLGGWDYSTHNSMTIVQSGVYWVETDGSEYAYYRGFDKGALTRDAVLAAWKNGDLSLPIPSTRFITLGSALSGGTMFTKWRTWHTSTRRLQLTAVGTKRRDIGSNGIPQGKNKKIKSSAHKHLIKTLPEDIHFYGIDEPFSHKYPLPWEYNETLAPDNEGVPEKIVEQEIEDCYL